MPNAKYPDPGLFEVFGTHCRFACATAHPWSEPRTLHVPLENSAVPNSHSEHLAWKLWEGLPKSHLLAPSRNSSVECSILAQDEIFSQNRGWVLCMFMILIYSNYVSVKSQGSSLLMDSRRRIRFQLLRELQGGNLLEDRMTVAFIKCNG